MSNAVSHKELQAATKDLNEALCLEPKLKVIAVQAAKMGDAIINAIAPLVDNEAEIAKLAPATIETYNKLVAAMSDAPPLAEDVATEVVQEVPAEEVASAVQQEAPVDVTAVEEGDCFGVSYDPANPACSPEACSQSAACAEKVTGKAKKKGGSKSGAKKEAKPKAPSNKLIVFQAWKGNGELTTEQLAEMVQSRVKENTIKVWIGQWKHDKNLPANV